MLHFKNFQLQVHLQRIDLLCNYFW